MRPHLRGLERSSSSFLGELPGCMEDYLSGSEAEVPAAMDEFRQAGAKPLMFRIEPYTPGAFNPLARSFRRYQQQTSP